MFLMFEKWWKVACSSLFVTILDKTKLFSCVICMGWFKDFCVVYMCFRKMVVACVSSNMAHVGVMIFKTCQWTMISCVLITSSKINRNQYQNGGATACGSYPPMPEISAPKFVSDNKNSILASSDPRVMGCGHQTQWIGKKKRSTGWKQTNATILNLKSLIFLGKSSISIGPFSIAM